MTNHGRTPIYITLLAIAGLIGLVVRSCVLTRPSHSGYDRALMVSHMRFTAIGIAIGQYYHERGKYPPPYAVSSDGMPLLSWRVLLLPYLGEEALYEAFDLNEAWDSSRNKQLLARMPDVYCGSLSEAMMVKTQYHAIVGPRTMWTTEGAVRERDITDGKTNTIAAVELHGRAVPWTAPEDTTPGELKQILEADSREVRIGLVLFMYPSVRVLPDDITGRDVEALSTISGGEDVSNLLSQ